MLPSVTLSSFGGGECSRIVSIAVDDGYRQVFESRFLHGVLEDG